MKKIRIAVDGPAGAGKSTMSRYLAQKLDIIYLDTGAMYRAAALKALREGVDPKNEQALSGIVKKLNIAVKYKNNEMKIYLDGEDVSGQIRTREVSVAASDIAVHRSVREKLVEIQRAIAKKQSVIMDGRDIGTNVLKDADIKIFLTAETGDRAKRRELELSEKGEKPDYQEVLKDISYRDKNDSAREFAPLKKAEDAHLFDTTGNTLDESKEMLYEFIKEEIGILKYRRFRKGLEFFVRALLKLIYKIDIKGTENVPAEGRLLVCANHSSYVDVPLLECYIKRLILFMAKKELSRIPFISYIVKAYDSILVDRTIRDVSAAKEAYTRLKRDRCIGIFPEGTRSVHIVSGKKKYRIRTGAVKLAAETGTPILPVGIRSTFKMFSKISMVIGKPYNVQKCPPDMKSSEYYIKEAEKLMDNIYGLTGGRNVYINR